MDNLFNEIVVDVLGESMDDKAFAEDDVYSWFEQNEGLKKGFFDELREAFGFNKYIDDFGITFLNLKTIVEGEYYDFTPEIKEG